MSNKKNDMAKDTKCKCIINWDLNTKIVGKNQKISYKLKSFKKYK